MTLPLLLSHHCSFPGTLSQKSKFWFVFLGFVLPYRFLRLSFGPVALTFRGEARRDAPKPWNPRFYLTGVEKHEKSEFHILPVMQPRSTSTVNGTEKEGVVLMQQNSGRTCQIVVLAPQLLQARRQRRQRCTHIKPHKPIQHKPHE